MAYTDYFKLSITEAMRDQLLGVLIGLTPAELTHSNLAAVERRGGIYQLLVDGRPVYIGKSTNDLRRRLEKHSGKLAGRVGFLTSRTTFRCAYVDEDLDALAPEKMLISSLRILGDVPWNNNGFGNNDPGRKRDESLVKINHFDRSFPIDLDCPVTLSPNPSRPTTLSDVMNQLKLSLPYNFRFSGPRSPEHRELVDIDTGLNEPVTQTAGSWLSWIAALMPKGWLLVALPGYIIGYKESDPTRYGSRLESWASTTATDFLHETHTPLYEGAEDIAEEEGDNRN